MNEMMNILMDMVNHGYYLVNETPEQFIARMIRYGFTANDLNDFRTNFFKARGIT